MKFGWNARATRAVVGMSVAAMTLALGAPSASAGGYDWPGIGTRGMGRAGAWGVRSDSAMALHVNPANLARLSRVQAELSLHLSSLNACFDRTGTPTRDGSGAASSRASEDSDLGADTNANVNDFGAPSDYANLEYPEICNGAGVFPVPQFGLAIPVHDRVSIGAGLIAPNNGGGHRSYGATGGPNVGTYAVDGAPTGRLPAPSRYDVIEANVLLAFIGLGVGIEVHERLRVGVMFGWGFAKTGFLTTVGPIENEDFARDIIAEVDARDLFVPRIGFSVAADPFDGFEVMAGFTWTGDVEASGNLNLRPIFWGDPSNQPIQPRSDPTNPNYDPADVDYNVNLNAPQTSTLRVGARYAMERDCPGEEDDFDPMRDEVFDVELDVVVSFGKRVDEFQTVTGDGDGRLYSGVAPGIQPPAIALPHNWKTQVMVALGGDINVLPEVLSLRLGLAYETDGIEAGYERLDFMPWKRMAGSFGATLRIQGFELSLAFMHLHWFNRSVSESEALVRVPVAVGIGTVVNAGEYPRQGEYPLPSALSYRFD